MTLLKVMTMNKMSQIIFLLSLTSLFISPNTQAVDSANDSSVISCEYKDDYLGNLTTDRKELQQKALRVGREICLSSLKVLPGETIQISDSLKNFVFDAKNTFDEMFPNSTFEDIDQISTLWTEVALRPTNDYRNYVLIEGERKRKAQSRDWLFEVKLYGVANSEKIYQMNDDQVSRCAQLIDESNIAPPNNVKDCKNALDLWRNAVSPFQYLYSNRVLQNNAQKITALQNQWSKFIEESRYQTPLDVWATTTFYGDQYKANHLSGPPDAQLFLLHPTLVYEHLHDAERGDRDDVSLAIEWVGVNWWQTGFGFSITSVYKDRMEQPSVGTGVTFHIKNKFSVGYVNRSNGDDSIFFNINFLEWFGEEKEKYKKYKSYF